MISRDKITEIYFIIDEFHKEFEKAKQGHILSEDNSLKRRNRKQKLSDSEVICIMTLFHYGNFRNLKHFYLYYVKVHMQQEFPRPYLITALWNCSKSQQWQWPFF